MKKLLAILGAVGLTATAGSALVSCGSGDTSGEGNNNGNQNSTDLSILVPALLIDVDMTMEGETVRLNTLFSLIMITFFVNEKTQSTPTWEETKTIIKDNQKDWKEFSDSVLKDGKIEAPYGDEGKVTYQITDFNKNKKTLVEKSIELLLNDNIEVEMVPDEMYDYAHHISSNDQTKYQGEFTISIQNQKIYDLGEIPNYDNEKVLAAFKKQNSNIKNVDKATIVKIEPNEKNNDYLAYISIENTFYIAKFK
ncbi:lipoprotein [Mesoplasma florum]|uniref:lipoprotein n=1 Tax=Mesoplasma florum TaxID=2151 RepID=UPI000BE3AE5D|nr:lipoprotein [Mesoplasma florum]ATI74086.1 hypothetical protein CQZ70_02395 [Mesoplasma florum]